MTGRTGAERRADIGVETVLYMSNGAAAGVTHTVRDGATPD